VTFPYIEIYTYIGIYMCVLYPELVHPFHYSPFYLVPFYSHIFSVAVFVCAYDLTNKLQMLNKEMFIE
jgi:hypothetical protein